MPLSIDEFPNSLTEPFVATSPKDFKYNCIGWACGTKTRMWPNMYSYYWPPGIPTIEDVNSFIELFQSKGYEVCDNGDLEKGYLKVAIYAYHDGKPSHAARQLENGKWTSKLGVHQDVSHSIFSMSDGDYGNVVHYMRKPK